MIPKQYVMPVRLLPSFRNFAGRRIWYHILETVGTPRIRFATGTGIALP
jgi:hypothetical protein